MEINPIGDLHIGQKAFQEKILKEKLKKIEDNRSQSRILLMGDLLEMATKTSIGAGVYEANLSPQDQLKYLVSVFKPVRDLIDGVVTGNHEERMYKDLGFDIMEMFCSELSLPYLRYSGVVTYAWNKRAYTVNMWHGKGGGGSTGGALNKCIDMSKKVFADVYCMGHVHKIGHTSRLYNIPDTRNGKISSHEQYFVLTGSALGYDDSYPDMTNLEVSKLGFPTIVLSGEQKKREIKIIE